jgi:hypothetical protein
MDMLAIPDFSAGAMENYGCVTYRETAILWDPAKSAAAAKQRVACALGSGDTATFCLLVPHAKKMGKTCLAFV